MTKKKIVGYLLTPSLIDSLNYYIESNSGIEAIQNLVSRVPILQTNAMLDGIQYEEDTFKGLTNASKYIVDSAYQVSKIKQIELDGETYFIKGRCDFIKAGIVYDIKKKSHPYQLGEGRYKNKAQTVFYLNLFEGVHQMTYIVSDIMDRIFLESYYKDEVKPIETVIRDFINTLKTLNLYELYKEKWEVK